MSKFIVEHVTISHKTDGSPKLMSLHIPIDGKTRIHIVRTDTPMFNSIINKLGLGQPIVIEAEFVTLNCPTHYALIEE